MSNYTVNGHFFNKNCSTAYKAALHLHDNGTVTLTVSHDDESQPPTEVKGTFPKAQLSIAPKLGDIPRDITFPNGYHFTPINNVLLHTWLEEHPAEFFDWVHNIESKKKYLLLAIIVVPIMLWGLFTRGIPYSAEKLADNFAPETIVSLLSIEPDDLKEYAQITESTSSEDEKQRITALFERALDYAQVSSFDYQLHFSTFAQDPEMLNAFALPNGNIVVTDAIIQQLSDDELLSVLLHEIGHVEERHGMRMLIEYSFSAIAYSFLIGGQEEIQNIIVGVNNMVLQKQFSRSMEKEADVFALTKLKEANISPLVFASALQKLKESHTHHDTEENNEEMDAHLAEEGLLEKLANLELFSTHPDIDSRIEQARKAAKTQ